MKAHEQDSRYQSIHHPLPNQPTNHSGERWSHLRAQGHASSALVLEVVQLLRHLLAGLAHVQLLQTVMTAV